MHCRTKERKRKLDNLVKADMNMNSNLQCKVSSVAQGVALTTSRIYVVIRSLVSLLVFASGNTLYKMTFQ